MKKVLVGSLVIAVIAIAGVSFASAKKEGVIKEKLDQSISEVAPFANIKYGDIDASILSDEITIHDLEITPTTLVMATNRDLRRLAQEGVDPKATIKSFTLTGDYQTEVPEEFSVAINQFHTNFLPQNMTRIFPKYAKGIRANLDVNYEISSGDNLTIDIMPDVENIGSIEASIDIGNFDEAYQRLKELSKQSESGEVSSDQFMTEMQSQMEKLTFKQASLIAKNDGVFEDFVSMIMQEQGLTKAETMAKIDKELNRSLSSAKRQGKDRQMMMIQEFMKFISDPEKMSFTVKPNGQRTMQQFANEMNRNILMTRSDKSEFEFIAKAN